MWFTNTPEPLEKQYEKIIMSKRMLHKLSEKSHKTQKQYEKRTREAVAIGDMERANLYASQTIRHKHLSLRYLKLSHQMEIVEEMACSAIATGKVTNGVRGILREVSEVANPMSMANSINAFEKIFDNLSIASSTVDNSLDSTATLMNHDKNTEAETFLTMLREENAMSQIGHFPKLQHSHDTSQHHAVGNRDVRS